MNPELRVRLLSSAFLILMVGGLTLWNVQSFVALCLFAGAILWYEWYGLTRGRGLFFGLLGILYIGGGVASLIYLRSENLNILLALFAIVWAGDIAAYIVGKRYGKHKIAPSISPGKSWEGLAGSVVASAVVAAFLGHVAPIPHAFLGALFAILGLGGDLFESALKRRAGVKDSGILIPGHGGIFDRVDALLPCAIFAAVALYMRLHMQ